MLGGGVKKLSIICKGISDFFSHQKPERDECFAIELGETDGGAELGKIKKCIVTIVNDDGKSHLRTIIITVSDVSTKSL